MTEPVTINNVTLTGRAQARDPSVENIGASFDANFSVPASYVFDLRTINQLRLFGIPRTLFIDNGSNPKEATVSVSITQQYFVVPAYAAGFFTINASDGSTITVASDGGASDLVTLTIFNYDLPPVVWYSFGTFNLDKPLSVYGTMQEGDNIALMDNNEAVYIGGKSPTGTFEPIAVNASGAVIVDGGSGGAVTYNDGSLALSGISEQLFAANPTRKYLLIQNVSANNIAVNLTGGTAVIGGAGSITLQPGGSIELTTYVTDTAINIIGTAADIVTAFEV